MIDVLAPAIAPLAERIAPGSSLLRVWELKGGISARTIAFEVQRPDGSTDRFVARCLPAADDLGNDLDSAGEFRLLRTLYEAGLPVPRPLYCEPPSEPLRTAVIVLDFVDGESDIAERDRIPLLREFAAQLAAVHRVDWQALDLAFLPERMDTWTRRLRPRPDTLDDSLDEGSIRDVLEAVWPLAPRNAPVLLHGDFWPGNLLWRNYRLAAVIDWEDAATGDSLSDLAITRLELLWRFDMAAAAAFTEQYHALTRVDLTDLPYWDLLAALRPAGAIATWADTPAAVASMRAKHRDFVRCAVAKLRRDG